MLGWRNKLDKAISAARMKSRGTNKDEYFTVDSFIELSGAPSREKVLQFVEEKIKIGELDVIYKVISPETRSVIEEYNSASKIPEEIYDDSSGNYINIDPLSDIEIVFRVSRNG